jgi:histone-lysine N-methyltransferase SETMAR
MSDNTLDFERKEFRSVIKYLFVKGLSGKEIFADMVKTLGDQCPSYAIIKNWVAEFKRGRSDVKDEHRSGRPISVTTPGNIGSVHDMILENRRIGLTRITETLHISYERVFHIVHHDLGMSKLAAKWVPKCLNADQKRVRLTMSEEMCHCFEEDSSNFLDRLVTMDETWVHHYDPETKEQSKEWKHAGSPRPKKFRAQKSAGKVLASVFWDKDGIILLYFLEQGRTITGAYYSELLNKLHKKIREKRRGKLAKGVLFLQDNAPAHKSFNALQKLHEIGFELIDHPPYSPDLAPSDYYLFPKLKKHLKGAKFSTNNEVICAVENWFADQDTVFFKGFRITLRTFY